MPFTLVQTAKVHCICYLQAMVLMLDFFHNISMLSYIVLKQDNLLLLKARIWLTQIGIWNLLASTTAHIFAKFAETINAFLSDSSPWQSVYKWKCMPNLQSLLLLIKKLAIFWVSLSKTHTQHFIHILELN